MKNIKNTIAAMSLMVALGMGATAANAGMMMGDRSVAPAPTACSGGTGILNQLEGILIVGFASIKGGIMMSDRDGIMMSDRATPCTEGKDDGILIVG